MECSPPSVIEEAGGAISVLGGASKGTVFEIYLPRLLGEAVDDLPAVGVDEARGSETILLVEDEPAVRRLARRILEKAGYRVIEAATGLEALSILQQGDDHVDLLLTDVVMPNMNGLELSKQIREKKTDVPIVMCTGFGSGERLFAPGADLWPRWEAHDANSTAIIDHGVWDRFVGRYVVAGDDGLNRVRYPGSITAV